MAGNIDDFADKIKTGNDFRLHRRRGQLIGIDTARSHFGGAISFRAIWTEAPVLQPLADRAQIPRQVLSQRLAPKLDLAQALREATAQLRAPEAVQ